MNWPVSSDSKSVAGALFWNSIFLSLGIFIGRITGFLRDVMVAAVYGADKQADVAVLILTIPDLLIGILVGGGLSAAFIPEFNKNAGKRRIPLFWQGSLVSLVGFSFLTLILSYYSIGIVQLLAPGLDQAQVQASSGILLIALWVIPATVLAGMTTAYLNAQNRFVITSLGTAILNLVIIAALIWIQFYGGGMMALGWAIVVGGAIRWVSQILVIRETFSFRDCFDKYLLHFDLFKRYSHVLLAGAVLVLFPVMARGVASMYEPGSIAIINYAWKLIQFPLGVGVGVISVVFFPYISRSFENNASDNESADMIIVVSEVVLILCVCIMLPMIIFSRDFSVVAFNWGAMDVESSRKIGLLAGTGLLSLPALGLSSVLVTVFNARRDTFVPLIINIVSAVVFLVLSVVGYYFMPGLEGIMISLVLSFYVMVALQVAVLSNKHKINIISLSSKTGLGRILLMVILAGTVILNVIQVFGLIPIYNVGLAVVTMGVLALMAVSFSATYRNILLNAIRRRR